MALAKKKAKKTKRELVEEELKKVFPTAETRQYNPVSIRVRIKDERFTGQPWNQREQAVHEVLKRLPKDVQADVTMLVLLEPGEESSSLLNYEFDNPSADRL